MNFKVGDQRTDEIEITRELVEGFAQFSGDVNPIHLDSDYAKTFGFPDQVAHGVILMAMLSKMIGMDIPGPGALWLEQNVNWLKPVFIGDKIALQVTVDKIAHAVRVLDLHVEATNQKKQLVMKGRAKVKVSEKVTDAAEKKNDGGCETILVTGGSQGIGAAIAKSLAVSGRRIAVNYLSSESKANEVVGQLQAAGAEAVAVKADIRQEQQADALVDQVFEQLGPIDGVVHAASPAIESIDVVNTTPAALAPYMETYVNAMTYLVRKVAPMMQEKKFGRIVALGTSAMDSNPPKGWVNYLTAKHALWGLTRSLAHELGHHGITANLVSPSLTITNLTADIPIRAKEVEARRNPVRRLAVPEDTGELIRFLMGPSSGFINAQNIMLTGGLL